MGGRIKREIQHIPLPPRLGKIKVGLKNQRGFPQSVDYFVATGKYASLFREVFGEKPNSLICYFPNSDPELVCKEEYVYRNDAGKKVASGDGETFKVWNTTKKAYVTCSTDKIPNVMEEVDRKFKSKTGWEVTLTLRVILPQMGQIYGYWEFQTKGAASTIPQVRDTFDALLAANKKVDGVLCDLNVEFAKSDSPAASRFPVVSLVPNETYINKEKVMQIEAK